MADTLTRAQKRVLAELRERPLTTADLVWDYSAANIGKMRALLERLQAKGLVTCSPSFEGQHADRWTLVPAPETPNPTEGSHG